MAQTIVETEATHAVQRYIDECKRGLSRRRKDKIRYTLVKLERDLLKKPLEHVTKDDLEQFIETFRAEEEFEESTKTTYLKISKPFFAWLHPEDPKFASWIKTGTYHATVGPDDILTPQELGAMRQVCMRAPHNLVRLETLYETAARPMEFLAAWKHDLTFEPNGPVNFHVEKGKGGWPRDVLLFQDAKPLLQRWVFNEHPLRERQDDFPLWVDMSSNSTYKPLGWLGLSEFIERVARAAKIKKRVTSYTLRHTRLTELARQGASEALLSQIAGWKVGSKMPAVYIHLSKRDQRPMMEKLLGIKSSGEQNIAPKMPKVCPNCKTENVSDSKVCRVCGMALDAKTAVEMIQRRDDDISNILKEIQRMRAKDAEDAEEKRALRADIEALKKER
jgi:integrase